MGRDMHRVNDEDIELVSGIPGRLRVITLIRQTSSKGRKGQY